MNDATSLKGGLYIFISALFFGTYGIWSRLMTGFFSEFSQAWTRGLILLLLLIPFGILTHKFKKIERKDMKWFVLIALCGGLNQAPYFYGFEHLPIGTATLLLYTSLTIGAYIIGKFSFKESITRIKYASLILSIIGMCFIYSFSLASNQIIPAIASMFAGFMGATVVVFSKKISHNYSETQIMTSFLVVMFAINTLASSIHHDILPSFTNTSAWIGQFGYAAAMIIANAFVIIGFKYIKEPSVGGLIGLFEILWGVVFGIIFFHEPITLSFFLGSVVIILAIALPDLTALVTQRKLLQ